MSKIKTWVDLPPKDLTWSEAMLGFVAAVGAYLTTGQIIPGFV